MAEVLERLAATRAAVEQSCQLLLTPFPEVLNQCAGLLSGAISELSAGKAGFGPSLECPAQVLAEARELRSKVLFAKRLLDNAASYYAGWDRVQRSMVGGYTSGGDAAVVETAGSLRVEG